MPNPRLLIIDDEHEYCSDLSLLLGQRFEVALAYDGASALEYLNKNRPDIILLDVNLGPNSMPGLEILEHIRALDCAPPVIMLSGN